MKNKKIEDILKEFDRAFNEIPYRSGMLVDVQADDVKAFISVSLQSIYEQGKKDATLEKVDELDVPYFMKAYKSVIRKQLLDEIMEMLKNEIYQYSSDLEQEDFDRNNVVSEIIEIIKDKYNQ